MNNVDFVTEIVKRDYAKFEQGGAMEYYKAPDYFKPFPWRKVGVVAFAIQSLKFFTFGIVILAAFVLLISDICKMPDVYYSFKQNHCVRVVNFDPDNYYTCENLPTRYNLIYVN